MIPAAPTRCPHPRRLEARILTPGERPITPSKSRLLRDEPLRRRLRRSLLVLIGALYLLSVPWYRPTQSEVGVHLGLPDWVALALCCYVAVAVLNALAWLLTDVSDEPPPDQDSP